MKTFTITINGVKRCEHELKCCPYCGSSKIHMATKEEASHRHCFVCQRCLGVFYIPCSDRGKK